MSSFKPWRLGGLLVASLACEQCLALPATIDAPTTHTLVSRTCKARAVTNGTWIGADAGIPALTAADRKFIIDEVALTLAGFPDDDAPEQGSGDGESPFSGPNTKKKWNDMDMDNWINIYVNTIDIPGKPGQKLVDSDDFMKDFWLSTGEENEFTCRSLSSSCSVADISDRKRYSFISEDDALKAQFARQVFKVFQAGNKQAYDVLNSAVANSQLPIVNIHKNLLNDDPPASTNILDVFMPAMAAICAFVPTLAPVANLLNNIYAAVPTNRRRDVDDDGYPVANATYLDKRAEGDNNVLLDIINRVEELEKTPTKDWIDTMNKKIDPAGKAVDKAAKAYAALLALNPGLKTAKISAWADFDDRVQTSLLKFPTSVMSAFEQNIKTWWAKEGTNAAGKAIGVGGMRQVFMGGEWAKTEASTESEADLFDKARDFLKTFIFMQVVQNQGIYFWAHRFDSESACKDGAKDAISRGWLAKDGWQRCELYNGRWELRYARRPTYNRGEQYTVDDKSWNPYGDLVKVTMAPDSGTLCYVQLRSGDIFKSGGFNQASAGLNKWSDAWLSASGLNTFKLDDVWKASRECQDANGDPFAEDQPRQEGFYPGMQLTDTNDILKGTLPKCMFNIPIFSPGDNNRLNWWCGNGLGKMHAGGTGRRSYFQADGYNCDYTLEYWSLESDQKICLTNDRDYISSKRAARPGCESHDRGIHLVGWERREL